VTIAAVLAAYAAFAGLHGGSLLRRGRWASRAPLPGIIIWVTAAWSVIVAIVLAGVSLAVGSTAIGGQLSYLIGACVIRLRSAYATPGGRSVAWAGLIAAAIILAWAALAVVRYLGTDRRRALRHAEAARMVGQREPALGAVLVEHAVPAAYSISSRPPTVVVTSGALRVLDAAQLAAVLAHEHAHLRAHHHLLQALAKTARRTAPFLPLLRDAEVQVATLIELHADDVATRLSGPAPLASALAILATAASPGPSPGLSATSADVLQRIHRLLGTAAPAGPIRHRLLGIVALALAVGPILLALLPAIVALALGKVPTALPARCPLAPRRRLPVAVVDEVSGGAAARTQVAYGALGAVPDRDSSDGLMVVGNAELPAESRHLCRHDTEVQRAQPFIDGGLQDEQCRHPGVDVPERDRPARLVAIGPALVRLGIAVKVDTLA
jgi:Zn-dependent protease with chaperone function